VRELGGSISPGRIVAVGAGIALFGGIILGLLAWFSGGAAGPGRLVDVGPSPIAVAGWSTLEFAVAAIIALFVADRGFADRGLARRGAGGSKDSADPRTGGTESTARLPDSGTE
jgi:hypothetical protein